MAEGAQLATGWLELTVSTKGAQKSITNGIMPAGKKAGGMAGGALGATMLAGIKKFAGPIALIVAGFSVGKFVRQSVVAFEALVGTTNKLQRIAGGTKIQVSGLAGAMRLSGVEVDKAQGGLTIFAKNLGNANTNAKKGAAIQAALGFSFKDAHGQVKPMSDILPGLSDKFAAMPDGASKAALATQLFGRSGAQLLPFLNKGSAGIADLTAQATKMGLVVDDVSGATFAKARMSTRLFAAANDGLKVTLGGSVIPILDGLQNIYRNAITPVLTSVTGFLQRHRDMFLAVGSAVDGFADKVGGKATGALSAIAPVLGSIASMVSGVFGPVFAQLQPVFASLVPQLVSLWSALSPVQLIFKSLAPVLPQLVGLLGTLVAAVGGALGSALQQILPALTVVAGVLTGALGTAIEALMPVVTQLVGLMGSNLTQVFAILAPIIGDVATVLGGALGQIIPVLVPIISMLAGVLGQVFTALAPLFPVFLAILKPILGLIAPLLSLIGPILTPLIQLLSALLTPILALIQPLMGVLVPILSQVGAVLTFVANIIGHLLTGSIQILTDILSGNFAAVLTDTKTMFGNIWNDIAGFFQSSIDNIMGAGQGLIDFFTSMWKSVIDTALGAGKWLYSAGRDLVQGLMDGAGSLLKNIGGFFLSILPGWIVEPFKSALGIHSPSTVFAALGVNTMQGYIDGVDSHQSLVNSSLSNAVRIPGVARAGMSSTSSATAPARAGSPGVNVQQYITTNDPLLAAQQAAQILRHALKVSPT